MHAARTTIAILVSATGIGVIHSSASAQQQYTITDLGGYGGSDPLSWYKPSVAINNQGQIAGMSKVPPRAFRYSGGMKTDLGSLGDSSSQASAINNSGQVAGWSFIESTRVYHAFRYDGSGPMIDIGLATAQQTFAYDINDSGQVVGKYSSTSENTAFRTQPNAAIDPNTDRLGHLGWFTFLDQIQTSSTAYGINNLGQVVGVSVLELGKTTAFRTGPNAVINPATDNLGYLGGSSSRAYAINDAGQVVGGATLIDGVTTHAFLYSGNGPMTDLGTLSGYIHSYAFGINTRGDIVGAVWAGDPESTPTDRRAFVRSAGGVMKNLNDLIPWQLGWVLMAASDINDSGQIVGIGRIVGDTTDRVFLLTPLPPIIATIPDRSVEAGTPYVETPSLTQGEPPITWSLVTAPEGMTVDPNTGVVTWTAPTATGSPYTITLKATKTGIGSDEKTWQLTVTATPTPGPGCCGFAGSALAAGLWVGFCALGKRRQRAWA